MLSFTIKAVIKHDCLSGFDKEMPAFGENSEHGQNGRQRERKKRGCRIKCGEQHGRDDETRIHGEPCALARARRCAVSKLACGEIIRPAAKVA